MNAGNALMPFDALAFVAWTNSSEHFLDGPHHTIEFVNGFGASIVRGWFTNGLWEVAVIHRSGVGNGLCYAIRDVCRYESDQELKDALFEILQFEPRPWCNHQRVEVIER